MKKMLANFAKNLISKEQMRQMKGGRMEYQGVCDCGNGTSQIVSGDTLESFQEAGDAACGNPSTCCYN